MRGWREGMRLLVPKRKSGRKPLRVAAYLRVSTIDQAKTVDTSLKAQANHVETWCKHRELDGYKVDLRWFRDEGKSGGEGKVRPEYDEMRVAIELGEIDFVVVYDLSRLSRSIRDFMDFYTLCKQHGTRVAIIHGGLDLSTEQGEFIARLLMVLAEFERTLCARRVREARRARLQQGRFAGSFFPLGLTTQPNAKHDPGKAGVLLRDKKTFPVVLEVFKAFEKVGSLRGACKLLRERGVLDPPRMTRKTKMKHPAKPLTASRLQRILQDVSYIGLVRIPAWYVHEEYTEEDHGKNPQFVEVKAKWKAFIEPERFNRVQEMIARNRLARGNTRKGTRRDRGKYPLSGIAVCGYSGIPLTGSSAKGRYRYYAVDRKKQKQAKAKKTVRIGADELERFVFDRVKLLAQDADLLAKAEKRASKERLSRAKTREQRLRKLERELKSVRGEMEGLVQSVGKRSSRPSRSKFDEHVRRHYRDLERRAEALLNDIEVAKRELPLGPHSRRLMVQSLKRLTKLLDSMEKGEQARLLALFITRLEVYKDRIALGLRNAPLETVPLEKGTKNRTEPPWAPFGLCRNWLPGEGPNLQPSG